MVSRCDAITVFAVAALISIIRPSRQLWIASKYAFEWPSPSLGGALAFASIDGSSLPLW